MNVHGKIVDDLRSSLSDLGEILSVRPDRKDPVLIKMHTDAKLYSFLYSTEVFVALLMNLLLSNVDDESDDTIPEPDVIDVVGYLRISDEIDEKQLTSMLKQFAYRDVLVCDRKQMTEEMVEDFTDGLTFIPQFYTTMNMFLLKVQTDYDLYDLVEDEDGH